MSDQVRMLEDASTHDAGEIGRYTSHVSSSSDHRWIIFEKPTRGAWCLPSEYELLTDDTTETPALAEEPHQVISAATDAFNETLARVAEEVATRCNLSISIVSELLVTGWSFTAGTDSEPNRWTGPSETQKATS